jgi:hypothetical protein
MTVLIKYKSWVLAIVFIGTLPIVFALPWLSSKQKFLVIFTFVTIGTFFRLYKSIKSRNTLVIVVDILFSIIISYCLFIFLQRY